MHPVRFVLATVLGIATASAQSHFWVSPTGNDGDPGTSAQPFQTINHAASVANAGDVIHLVAATYGDEQGHVVLGAKNLTLVGAGVGATVIKANSSLNQILPAGLLATPVMDTHRCAVTLQGSATTWLRDLTLDQGFSMPPSGRGYSLWVGTGADAVLDNVECKNARANPINGIQGPLGVNIRGDGVADTTNVTMRNCRVHEFGKGGVVANFDAHLVMDDCRIDGFNHAFSGLAAQNGVQVSRGATCEIRRCTITDIWYDPPGTVATGMLFFDAGPNVLVEDCDLGNCQVGFYFFASVDTAISGTIRRNRVHSAEYGFYTDNVSGLAVTDNSFSTYLAGDGNDAADDIGGNTYSGNHYSSITVAGPHVLAGDGASADADAQPFSKGFASGLVTNLPAGRAPVDLVVTDLDGDGTADFAALQQGVTPALAIGLNTSGTFAVTSLPFGVAAGDPVAVVAGDFDGVVGRDLAVLTVSVPPSTSEHKIYVFANDGSGGFSLLHTHTIAGATSPIGLAARALDAVAGDDPAVSDAGAAGFVPGSARALRNNGTGTSFTAVPLVAAYTAACRDVAIADLDGDGFGDVAVAEGDSGTGRVHLFDGDGAGSFSVFAGSPIVTSANPNRLLATDVEGDGDIDVLASASRDAFGFGPGGGDVLTNGGAATVTKALYFVDRQPTEMVAGDLDDDSDPDTQRRDVALVNAVGGSVSVLGSWSRDGAGSGGIAVAATDASGVGIADITGDGFADLVYCDRVANTVVVLPGEPQARADTYGAGSAGAGGLVPNLYPVGLPAMPVIPNPTFGFGLRNVRPFSIAVIAAASAPAPVVPNSLLIADLGATWAVVTNLFGRAAVPVPIPDDPMLIGLPIYCQAGIFDPNGNDTFLPGFALSNGLKLRTGF